ncbi:MAG: MCE family protein [Chthoniobacterales bacterium]|nr:MCE family protein [Chthoniobacterales bacterium]
MKRNLSDYLVALAVIICSVVLLGALTIALSGYRLQKPSRTLQLDYEDVTGIKVHSEVRYAGAPAGRVIAMKHLTAAERKAKANKKDAVRVVVELDNLLPPLPNDISASLGSDTLLSPKFVALSAGTPGRPTLANNAVIEGTPAFSLEEVAGKIGPVLANANKLIDNLNGTVTNVNGTVTTVKSDLGLFLPKLSPVADTARVDLEDLQKTIQGLTGVETKASGVFDTAGTFLSSTDQQLRKQMDELHVILLNLKVITTHAKALVDTLAEKPNRIIFSGKANKLTPEAEILKSKNALPGKQP